MNTTPATTALAARRVALGLGTVHHHNNGVTPAQSRALSALDLGAYRRSEVDSLLPVQVGTYLSLRALGLGHFDAMVRVSAEVRDAALGR